MKSLVYHLGDLSQTEQFGADLAIVLEPGNTVFLQGDLGAGKTGLARAIICQLSNDPELEVPSPTFSLVQHYETSSNTAIGLVQHADFYRLDNPQEIHELGIMRSGDSLTLVEWPEKAQGEFGAGDIHVLLEEEGKGRRFTVSGNETLLAKLQRSLLIREFLDKGWHENIWRQSLFGDASTRSYESVFNQNENRILMNAPAQEDGPIIRDGKPYSQLAHLAEDVSSFVGVQSILTKAGLSAPQIHAKDLEEGLLLLEDLGEGTIVDNKRQPIEQRYMAAIEMLASFHGKEQVFEAEAETGLVYKVPEYSRAAMLIETELLPDWYAPFMKGKPLDAAERDWFVEIWNKLTKILEADEKVLVMRDFHSPNIIWLPQREGIRRAGVIDFQDAVIGPPAYDVASLAQDARIDISAELEARLVDHYVSLRKKEKAGHSFDESDFRQSYAIMAAQRATKILGIFVRLDQRDNKPAYLKHLPRMQEYLQRSFAHPVLVAYRKWYEETMQDDMLENTTVKTVTGM